jgi:uncharacterized membrane protein (DUF373 family)
MERSVPFLNGCISFVAFITALALVIYMLIAFISGMFDLSLLMYDTAFLDPVERQNIFNQLNSEFLHNIAVLLILMKAYRILVEYMKFHHIDIKFMVEIGIITVVLELLFNSQQYTEDMRIVMVSMAVTFLAIYAFRYDTLVKATKDAQKEHGKMKKGLLKVK